MPLLYDEIQLTSCQVCGTRWQRQPEQPTQAIFTMGSLFLCKNCYIDDLLLRVSEIKEAVAARKGSPPEPLPKGYRQETEAGKIDRLEAIVFELRKGEIEVMAAARAVADDMSLQEESIFPRLYWHIRNDYLNQREEAMKRVIVDFIGRRREIDAERGLRSFKLICFTIVALWVAYCAVRYWIKS